MSRLGDRWGERWVEIGDKNVPVRVNRRTGEIVATSAAEDKLTENEYKILQAWIRGRMVNRSGDCVCR